MPYLVKEIFYTLQGEGAHAGRPAVFCRFAGCNLWSGREEDRAQAACRFCDTDFRGTDGTGGGRFESAEELAGAVAKRWTGGTEDPSPCVRRGLQRPAPFVVCTGGEPLLQLDDALVTALHGRGLEIAVETNGTRRPPAGIDWVCVSPKAGAEQILRSGHELKLVYPQPGAEPERFESQDFRHFFLQPLDGPHQRANTQAAVRYCLEHPNWRLSLQLHKMLGIR